MSTGRWVTLVVVAVIMVAAYRLFLRKVRPQSHDPNQFMPQLAQRAVAYAAEHGRRLDYSAESVQDVEALLGELHDLRAKGSLDDRGVNQHALRFGAYVGEVLRRRYNGTWHLDHEVGGPSSFPISWGGGESFPVTWCGKRILNGDEDNVWFKYQVVTSDEYRRGPATQPTDH